MKNNFDSALEMVLVHEGGFSNNPRDPGGATMKGVTFDTFKRFFGNDQTVENLKNITTAQLGQIYRTGYWDACKCDDLPSGVDFAVFDLAVNSGPGTAGKFLQRAVGATADGAIGPKTLERVALVSAVDIINSVCDQRLAFMRSLSTFSTFGNGWTRRVSEVRQQALNLANGEVSALAHDPDFETVRLGSTGPWVVKLQAALGLVQDGSFGPITEAKVKTFQKDNGLFVDGVAGRNTFRALGLLA